MCLEGTGVCRESYVPGHRTAPGWVQRGLSICRVGGGVQEEHAACVLEDPRENAPASPTARTPPFCTYRLCTHCVPDPVLGPQTLVMPTSSLTSHPPSHSRQRYQFEPHWTESFPCSESSSGL